MGKLFRFPTHQDLYDRVTAVEELAKKNKEDVLELNLKIQDLEENINLKLVSFEQDLFKANSKLEDHETRLNNQDERLNNNDLVLINHEERLDNLRERVDLMELHIDDIAIDRDDINDLKERMAEQEELSINYGVILNNHTNTLTEYGYTLVDHTNQLLSLDNNIKTINTTLTDYKVTIDSHETRLSNIDAKFIITDNKLIDHETRIDALEKYEIKTEDTDPSDYDK